jgi:hypothetical protein
MLSINLLSLNFSDKENISFLVINCVYFMVKIFHHEAHEETRRFFKFIILRDLRGCTEHDLFGSPPSADPGLAF